MSKTWHQGLLNKLEPYDVKGKLINFLTNYLHERTQVVVIISQTKLTPFVNYLQILRHIFHSS